MIKNSRLIIIAKKEYTDAFRNALFRVLALFLFLLVGVSILVASLAFQSHVAQYHAALAQFTAVQLRGVVLSPPAYFPLQILRAAIEYLEIIGAIIALVLGYLSIAKEKGNNTSRLLLTRSVTRADFVFGKILGNSAILLSLLVVIGVFIIAAVSGIGHVIFSGTELIKLMLVLGYTYVYLAFFFCFSAMLALLISDLPRALMLSFALWLVFVLIIPQVGDTMDPDNQVPGGFFASMQMTQDGQKVVIDQFKQYENFRNMLEVSSLEKHYERLAFATLGIKTMYNDKDLGFIMNDKWPDLAILFLFLFGSAGLMYASANSKRIIALSP